VFYAIGGCDESSRAICEVFRLLGSEPGVFLVAEPLSFLERKWLGFFKVRLLVSRFAFCNRTNLPFPGFFDGRN
jgi:hypothetical protein